MSVGGYTGDADRRPGESFAMWFRRRLHEISERAPAEIDRAIAPEFRDAGVLAPFWEEGGRIEVAFTLRTAHLSAHQGQISFPGGSLDLDESSLEAALRETEEELGISRERVSPVARLDDAWSLHGYIVTPHVGWLGGRPEFTPSPDEVERVIVADVEQLMSPSTHTCRRLRHGGDEYSVHYYDYDGDVIWGLTGGILHKFFALVSGRPSQDDTDGERSLRRFLLGSPR